MIGHDFEKINNSRNMNFYFFILDKSEYKGTRKLKKIFYCQLPQYTSKGNLLNKENFSFVAKAV